MCRLAGFTTRSSRRWIKKVLKVVFVLAVCFGLIRFKQVLFPGIQTNYEERSFINASINTVSPRTTSLENNTFFTTNSPSVQESSKSSESLSQEDFDFMAAELKVHFVFLSLTKAEITISYNGSKIIKNNGWAIYFSLASLFLPRVFRPHRLQENTFENSNNDIIVSHVEGHLYKLEPVTEWLVPGSSLKCTINALPIKLWTRFIVSPNWYITANGLKPRVITATANEDLHFVSSSETSNRNLARDNVVSVPDLGHAPLLVVPTPVDITTTNNSSRTVSVGKEWTVSGDDRLQNEVNFLSGKLGLQASSFNTKSKAILLILKPSSDVPKQFSFTANELYNLQVDDSKELITITGEAPAGVFYGAQTLLTLIKDTGEVPQLSIKDSPRFSYRGLMVDVARNFKPKQEIFKLLDVMAMYKLNKFHFHLSDSEAWRLKIPGIDELTTVGSKRCHDLQEKRCVMSQLGSGPDTSTSGTGHYSVEDYREILRHATERHIQVIPEFDLPGHSHAAIKSMIARHDRLMEQGKEEDAKRFLLTDLKDKSRYITIQGFTVDAVNPCIQLTYNFLDYLLSTLSRLHGDIQPLTLYHFGGDEVPRGVWEESPACHKEALKGNFALTKRVLMEHFVRNLSRVSQKYGLDIGGWSDAFSSTDKVMLNRATFGNTNAVAYFWGAEREHYIISNLLKEGYKVVLSPAKYFYLDHSHEPDFNERGLNWAQRYTDIRKTFGYSPLDDQRIMGLEGAMWGELVRTADQMHGMMFPRLLALAERAWHKASWEDLKGEERDREFGEDWVRFANTLGHRELGRLDKIGVAYHVPPPVARVVCTAAVCNRLHVTATLPGLKVEYSKDDGMTWYDVTAETEVNTEIQLRTRSADQKRFSRVIRLKPLHDGSHVQNHKEEINRKDRK